MIRQLVDYIQEKEFRFTCFTNRIHIVNYQKILILEDERISIEYNDGVIVIKGNNLRVSRLLDEEMLIYGKISQIEMKSNEK